MLALYLFGTPRLELDDVPVHIPRRKATALLAYLTVRGQRQSRDALATLLWPENDQSSARAELRRTLSVLMRTLGEGWLVTDRESAGLKSQNDRSTGSSFWLDVAAFQEKLKICESHNHPATIICPECTPALEAAVTLYQDDFMAGFSLKGCREFDEWQFFQAEKLRTGLRNALEQLSLHHAALGDYENAIQYAQRWLALDPLQEAAHRQLMSLFSRSEQRAATLRQYQICQQMLADELGVEPSAETKEQYRRIQASRLVTAASLRPKSNLPVQSTPFIGRESELAEIRTKLKDDDCRLLTLLGPGGSGKTWLAIETAGGIIDDFKNGVFFANLAPLEDPARILTTIAAALSFSFYEEGTPEEQLLDYLGNKQMLLILDNFEHLLAGVSQVNQILNAASGVKILATSRSRLMITGEHLFEVWGMAFPDSSVSLKIASHQYSAVRLFESEASRVKGDFKLTNDNLRAVIQVCSLLGGMPLGIVLAASWVMMLSPSEIAEEIAQDLKFLETELQDLPQRQRSLQSVFNHSWRLLSEGESKVMGALSVFRGGFTRDAAQKVAKASLRDLMGLTHKSFLHRTSAGRYEVHDLLGQYAAEKLGSAPTIEVDTRDNHSEYYCQALAVWGQDLEGPQQRTAMKEIAVEIDNIHSAWEWAVDTHKISALLGGINGLCHFYERRNQHVEGEKVCRSLVNRLEAMQASDQPEMGSLENERRSQIDILKLQVRALSWCGFFNLFLLNTDLAHELIRAGLNQLNETKIPSQETRFEKAIALLMLSSTFGSDSRSEAKKLVEDSLESFSSQDKGWWMGMALDNLGHLEVSMVERKIYFEESFAVRKKHGDLRGTADSLRQLSREAASLGQFERAERFIRKALLICEQLDDQPLILAMYWLLGSILVWQGKFSEARLMEHEKLAIYIDLGSPHHLGWANAIAGFPDLYMGAYEDAYNRAQIGLSLSQKTNHRDNLNGTVLSTSILGRVAMTKGSYDKAKRLFQESILICQTVGWKDMEGQEWACQGYAARGLEQMIQAQGQFYNALRIAVEMKRFLALIHALPGIALLFADQREVERAVEIYALAATQGIVANSKWFADIAGDEIAAFAEKLPVDVAEAAKARGRVLDLWETAEALLAELEQAGWGSANPFKNNT